MQCVVIIVGTSLTLATEATGLLMPAIKYPIPVTTVHLELDTLVMA
jgi:hypothetical protein